MTDRPDLPHSEAAPGAGPDAPVPMQRLFEHLYADLQQLAQSRLRRARHLTLLDTGALIHECFLRIDPGRLPEFAQPRDAIPYLSTVMRAVIVDTVRRRQAQRRGGGVQAVDIDELSDADSPAIDLENEIVEVDAAISELALAEPRLAQVVEMKFFGGFNEEEIARSLGVTERTVRRDWTKARALLRVALGR